MKPKTAYEFYEILFKAVMLRAYGDITTASRRKRLTEHDIALIERRILQDITSTPNIAHEFPDFDVRAELVRTVEEFRILFQTIRETRTEQMAKEN